MVVRKETQQTGVKVNQPAQRNVPHGMRALSAILAMVMTMALMLLYAPVPKAEAEETQESQSGTMLSIDSSTAVLTDTSGYHLSATVTNTTDQEIPSGTLTLAMNAFYTFVSRNDIQEWSEGIGQIPTPNIVGQSEVPALQPGASANVHIDADSNQETLASVNSWGPKPVTLSYEANGVQQDEAHTFATRTGAGINTPDTPAMNITIVQPLEAQGWTTDNTMLEQLVNKGGVTSAELSKIAVPGKEDEARLKSLEQTFTKHDKLQVVADPTYLKTMPMPTQVDGITQPALFDITAYSALNDSKTYDSAGVGTSRWNAEQALKNYQSALGDPNASMTTYAWQGTGNWTADALAKAKQQGYGTVIATHDFEEDDAATAETGKTVVTTDAGDITVLTAQSVLSNLAQGKATSADAEADGEGTTAGRLARFVAQSAFYQMEQPYSERNLLVCLNGNSDPAVVDALMTDVEQSPWLNITDLNTLNNADPALSGDDAAAIVPQSDGSQSQADAQHTGSLDKRHQTIQRVHPHRRRRRCQAGPRRPQSVAQAARQRARHHGPARARRRKSSRKHHGGRSRATGVPAHQRRGHHTDGKRQRGQRNRANARYHQQQPPLSGHGKSLIIDQLHADRHFAFRHRGSARAQRSPSGVHHPRGHLRHRGRRAQPAGQAGHHIRSDTNHPHHQRIADQRQNRLHHHRHRRAAWSFGTVAPIPP